MNVMIKDERRVARNFLLWMMRELGRIEEDLDREGK
jgi:hypothetical protein